MHGGKNQPLCCGLTTTSSALYFLIDKHCVVHYSLHNESESDSRLRKNKRKKESNALSFLGLTPCITVKVSRNELNHYKNIDYQTRNGSDAESTLIQKNSYERGLTTAMISMISMNSKRR